MSTRAERVASTATHRRGRDGGPGRGSGAHGLRRPVRRRDATVPFVAMIGQVAAAIRSGADPAAAWSRAGVRSMDGIPFPGELDRHAGPHGAAAVRAVMASARLSAEVGASPATMLDRVAAGLVRDAESEGQRRAALAGPRATSRLLAALPLLGLGLGLALGAEPWTVLLDGGAGTGLLVAGAVLTAAGQRWTGGYLRSAAAAAAER